MAARWWHGVIPRHSPGAMPAGTPLPLPAHEQDRVQMGLLAPQTSCVPAGHGQGSAGIIPVTAPGGGRTPSPCLQYPGAEEEGLATPPKSDLSPQAHLPASRPMAGGVPHPLPWEKMPTVEASPPHPPQPPSPTAGWESRISAGRRAIPGSEGLQGRREGAGQGSKYNVPGGAGRGGNCAGQEAASSCPSLGHTKDRGRGRAAGSGGSTRSGQGLSPPQLPPALAGETSAPQHPPHPMSACWAGTPRAPAGLGGGAGVRVPPNPVSPRVP